MADSSVIQTTVRRIRVNGRHALREGILLDPWLWEIDAVPGIGEVQEQINPDLDQAAVLVLILWNRIGSPTNKAVSGTVEEFKRAVESFRKTGWPRILVYYCKRKSSLPGDQLKQRGGRRALPEGE